MKQWENIKYSDCTLGEWAEAEMSTGGYGRERMLLSGFFGTMCYVVVSENISVYQHNTAQWVQDRFFEGKGFKKILETCPDHGYSLTPTSAGFEEIAIDHNKTFRGYMEAAIGYESNGDRVMVFIEKDEEKQKRYRIFSSAANSGLMKEWFEFASKTNFYKGKKITAACEFMNLKSVTWDDVILPDQVKKMLQGIVTGAIANRRIYIKNGLSLKRGVLLSGKPGNGKCAPLSSMVWTPSGPCRMGDLKLGDFVCTPDGSTASVTGIFPQGEKDNYRITFADGDTVESCDEHLWQVTTKTGKKRKILTLRQIIEIGPVKPCGDRRFQIEMPKPLCFKDREVLMDPYMMGVLLGDGGISHNSISLANEDQPILEAVGSSVGEEYSLKLQNGSKIDYRLTRDSESVGLPGIKKSERNKHINALRHYKLWGKTSLSKFIPSDYKYNTFEVRLAVLQGLMDTDGTVDASSGSGTPVFNTSSEQLAQDVKELVETLGGIATIKPKKTKYIYKGERRACAQAYRVFIRLSDPRQLFRLERKKAATFARVKYPPIRVIERIEKIGREQMQCIMVDHPEHLYLTDHCIVTHNTSAIRVMVKDCPESVTVIYAQPSQLRTSLDVRSVCQMAKELSPTLLIIEDMDWIAEDRNTGDAGRVIELMNQLDGLEDMSDVITIASTNELDKIEKAIKNRPGRFDRVIKIDNPDTDGRARMITLFCRKWITNEIDIGGLVRASDSLSGAHMMDLCKTAAIKAIECGSLNEHEIIVLTNEHFKMALKEVKDKDYSTYFENAGKIGFSRHDD